MILYLGNWQDKSSQIGADEMDAYCALWVAAKMGAQVGCATKRDSKYASNGKPASTDKPAEQAGTGRNRVSPLQQLQSFSSAKPRPQCPKNLKIWTQTSTFDGRNQQLLKYLGLTTKFPQILQDKPSTSTVLGYQPSTISRSLVTLDDQFLNIINPYCWPLLYDHYH